MAKYTTLVLLSLLTFNPTKAQQDVLYSQYMFDKMLINPAYSGSSSWVVGSLKNRMQFVNLEGAPVTNLFTFQAPFQARNVGLGAKLVQDKIAVTNSLVATGFFSYHIGFGSGRLSFGLEGGVMNNTFSFDGLHRVDHDDPYIPAGGQSLMLPEVSTGIFYQTRNMYIGASAYHLFSSHKHTYTGDINGVYNVNKTYYGVGGYIIELSRTTFLEPGFLIRYTTGAPLQSDLNLSLVLADRLSFGTSYRTGGDLVALIKIDINKNLKILYSYDYTLSKLGRYSSGSHEVGISYGIELLPPPEKKVIHPRYYF